MMQGHREADEIACREIPVPAFEGADVGLAHAGADRELLPAQPGVPARGREPARQAGLSASHEIAAKVPAVLDCLAHGLAPERAVPELGQPERLRHRQAVRH